MLVQRIKCCRKHRKHAAHSPVGCPSPALWGKREEAAGMVGAAVVFAFFKGGGGLY